MKLLSIVKIALACNVLQVGCMGIIIMQCKDENVTRV